MGRGAAEAASFERQVRQDLLNRRWLRLHVCCIAMLTLAACWGLSALLMQAGVQPLALRHALALVGAYAAYLGLMHLWARWMLRQEGPGPADIPFELADLAPPHAPASGRGMAHLVEGAVALDEGALVAVPLALVAAIALLLAAAMGFAVFGLFGIDILLGVAVEIAFASFGGALALRARREGWLAHVVRRTAGPMAVVLVCTVMAGLLIGHWLPEARTLPQAWQLMRGR